MSRTPLIETGDRLRTPPVRAAQYVSNISC